jgi:hypothetical protein
LKLTKFAKTNLIIAGLFIIIAFIYPFFIEKIFYSNKAQEARSIAKIIENVQNLNYINKNKYIHISKGDKQILIDKFNINNNDLKYYDYSVFTTFNTYTLYAEPKIKYLKNRDISPKIYVYYKKLNQKPIIKWQ